MIATMQIGMIAIARNRTSRNPTIQICMIEIARNRTRRNSVLFVWTVRKRIYLLRVDIYACAVNVRQWYQNVPCVEKQVVPVFEKQLHPCLRKAGSRRSIGENISNWSSNLSVILWQVEKTVILSSGKRKSSNFLGLWREER